MTSSDSRKAMPDFTYLSDEHSAFSLCEEAAVFRKRGLLSEDGVKLSVYEAGDEGKPTVVLINPLGISCLLMARMARRLANDYHVITWESRGLPDYASIEENAQTDWSVARHCQDLAGILKNRGRQANAVVAYCSRANVAIYGLKNKIIDAQKLCLVSPSLEMGNLAKKTDYQRTVLPLWLKIAQDGIRTASLVRVLLGQAEKNMKRRLISSCPSSITSRSKAMNPPIAMRSCMRRACNLIARRCWAGSKRARSLFMEKVTT